MRTILASLLLVMLTTVTVVAAPVRLVQADGTTWRGETDDHVTIEYKHGVFTETVTGILVEAEEDYIQVGEVVIFRNNIIAVKLASAPSTPGSTPSDPSNPAAPEQGNPAGATTSSSSSSSGKTEESSPGIFYLPLSGTVGVEFRPEEIEKIIAEADAAGDGQMIVLDIESGGGSVREVVIIGQTIMEASKRHRFVAWAGKSISAAAYTALACNTIIWKTHGNLGAITPHSGGAPIADGREETWIDIIETVLLSAGHSKHWALPMVRASSFISYVKDPVTGECTFYPAPEGVRGEIVISQYGENCVLNLDLALDCCLAYGKADTKEEFAAILDLPEWRELGTGQKMHDDLHESYDRCEKYIRKSRAELGRLGSKEQRVQLRERIKIYKRWIMWWKRVPNKMGTLGVPPIEILEQMIEDLERELKDLGRG